jgi:hypothetical protein
MNRSSSLWIEIFIGYLYQNSPQAGQIQQSLQLAIQQKNIEAEGDWKRSLTFLSGRAQQRSRS